MILRNLRPNTTRGDPRELGPNTTRWFGPSGRVRIPRFDGWSGSEVANMVDPSVLFVPKLRSHQLSWCFASGDGDLKKSTPFRPHKPI